MGDPVSTDQIEREIEVERVALARALADLQRQISPEALVERVSMVFRENGGEIAGTAMRQARENPIALALTGAGFAWLVAGPAKRTDPSTPQLPARRVPPPPPPVRKPQVGYDHRSYPTVGGFRDDEPEESFDARIARAETDDYDPAIRASATADPDGDDNAKRSAKGLLERLMEGTEMMTDTARDRVMAAREAAILAERRLEARARDYGAAGRDAFADQPLMGALVAFGVGALAGALLPRTRMEDRHLGAARDRALVEAERVYRTEVARLREQGETVVKDAVGAAAVAAVDDTLRNDDRTRPRDPATRIPGNDGKGSIG